MGNTLTSISLAENRKGHRLLLESSAIHTKLLETW